MRRDNPESGEVQNWLFADDASADPTNSASLMHSNSAASKALLELTPE